MELEIDIEQIFLVLLIIPLKTTKSIETTNYASLKIFIKNILFFLFRQLLSPNIQQKHYHVGGYLMDGNRHVSNELFCCIILIYKTI